MCNVCPKQASEWDASKIDNNKEKEKISEVQFQNQTRV